MPKQIIITLQFTLEPVDNFQKISNTSIRHIYCEKFKAFSKTCNNFVKGALPHHQQHQSGEYEIYSNFKLCPL